MSLHRVAKKWPFWLGPVVLTMFMNMGTTFAGYYWVNREQDRERAEDSRDDAANRAEDARIAAEATKEVCETRDADRDSWETALRQAGVSEADIAIFRANFAPLDCDAVAETNP